MIDLSPRGCCVLVPVGESIEPGCEVGLRTLEAHGFVVRRVRGYSQIDVARNAMVSAALRDGFDEVFWIDSDVEFHPDDVNRLRSLGLPISCGIYPKKGLRELACHVMPNTKFVEFGPEGGGLIELLYAATGFLHIRRIVFEEIQHKLDLAVCDEQFNAPIVPYFMPMIKSTEKGNWYLGEDYAFCERARQCGFKIIADTRIRLRHVGKYPYSWEDMGSEMIRYNSYRLSLGD